MLLILAALIATPAQAVRSVVIPPAAVSKPVRIDCPVGQLTQIVFPERLVMLKASAGAADNLGVAAEKSSPLGVVGVRPVKVGTGTLELRGPSLVLTILVRGVETGAGSEIRLTLGTLPSPAPSPSPVARAAVEKRAPQPMPPIPPPTLPPATLAAAPKVFPSLPPSQDVALQVAMSPAPTTLPLAA